MKKKILICGATGFIGKNFLEKFSQNNKYKVFATYHKKKPFFCKNVKWFKADLRVYNDCQIVTKNIEIILQLAATTSGSNIILKEPYIHVTDNAVMNSYILKAAFHNKIKHFIFTSCTIMYPNSKKKNTEKMVDESKIYKSYFGAAATKLYIEKICLFFSKISKTKFSIIRHSNIYGPNDKFDIDTGHFIGSSFKKILSKDIKNINIFGSGREKRDYLYIDDLIYFVEKLIKKQTKNFEIFNCSFGKSFSILNVLKKIIKITNSNKTIKHLKGPNLGIDILVSNQKAKKLLKWKPTISLEKGLRKTFNWYLKNK
tara:strand:+ start:1641 stop:2582 length:942 start_codon:yes stop_codon:yes gene_type:complete